MKKTMRLDKYLSDAGKGTRSEVKKLIKKGMVQVNGIPVKNPEQKVIIQEDEVTIGEEKIMPAAEHEYYLLHKPSGCVSATEDNREKTVMEYVPSSRKGLFPVGRLDKDTEGLLLITDDGALAHQLLSPKKHVEKTYYAQISGKITEADQQAIEKGVDIGDEEITLPASLTIISVDEHTGKSEILLTICEGRYHQVKRMIKAVGKEVTYLKRLSMGPLVLPDDLEKGECRALTIEEIDSLKNINDVERKRLSDSGII